MEREKKVQHCKNLLDSLGCYSSDEIAEVLHLNGIKGIRQAHMKCPLANWLRKEGVAQPVVQADKVGVARGSIIDDFPYTVSNFITKFDMGSYDFLEEEEEGASYG